MRELLLVLWEGMLFSLFWASMLYGIELTIHSEKWWFAVTLLTVGILLIIVRASKILSEKQYVLVMNAFSLISPIVVFLYLPFQLKPVLAYLVGGIIMWIIAGFMEAYSSKKSHSQSS